MPERITQEGAIAIDGKFYELRDKVRWGIVSGNPPKFSTGAYTEDTNPRASTVYWDDLSGGIGAEDVDPKTPERHKRAWYGPANLRHPGQVILPGRVIATAQATTSDVDAICDYNNTIYKCHGTTVYEYEYVTDTNTSSRTLLNAAKDWARGLVGGTDTLVIATGAEVDYLQSTTWARNTTDIDYVTFLNELLWGLDATTGQLYYTDDLSAAWSSDAVLQTPADYATSLFTVWDGERRRIAVGTRIGIYLLDDEHRRFEPASFSELPYHPDGGLGLDVWRGAAAYAAGSGMHLVGFSDSAPVGKLDVAMGPDRDHGLPSNRRGTIVDVAASHNELFAAMDGTKGLGFWETTYQVDQTHEQFYGSTGAGTSRISTFGIKRGYSTVLGWNEAAWRRHNNSGGWQVTWESESTALAITAITVSDAYSRYNLWIGANHNVYYLSLPTDVVNPLKVTTSEFDDSTVLYYPRFSSGMPNEDFLALSFVAQTTNPSTSETMKLQYATDYADPEVSANLNDVTFASAASATISASGRDRAYLGTNREGVVAQAVQPVVTLSRGAGNLNSTPILRLLGMAYRVRPRRMYGIRAPLKITERSPDGRDAKTQRADLRAAMNNTTLLEVTWRDDDSNVENYYMDPEDLITEDESGRQYETDQVDFVAVEPEQSTSR